jgi:hypothetical protein
MVRPSGPAPHPLVHHVAGLHSRGVAHRHVAVLGGQAEASDPGEDGSGRPDGITSRHNHFTLLQHKRQLGVLTSLSSGSKLKQLSKHANRKVIQ